MYQNALITTDGSETAQAAFPPVAKIVATGG